MRIIIIIVVAILSLIALMVWYENKYPCVRGHYEQRWQPLFDGKGRMISGYFHEVWVCDERVKKVDQ